MALKTINIGNVANDGSGDDLREAFSKVNDNFTELELRGGQANTISNIGTGSGLYKEKIGVDLRLKTIKAGEGILIESLANEVLIRNTQSSILKINADTGTLFVSAEQEINIVGGNNISTQLVGGTLTITGESSELFEDKNPRLGESLLLNGYNIFSNLTDAVDSIDNNMVIARDSQGGIYNRSAESNYDFSTFSSPAGTLWNADGWTDLLNVSLRTYTTFAASVSNNESLIGGTEFIMKDTFNNKFYKIKFNTWDTSDDGAGFSYVRTRIDPINGLLLDFPVTFTKSPYSSLSTIQANKFVGNTFNGTLRGDVIGNVTGNVTGLVNGLDVRTLSQENLLWDFGPITGTIRTLEQYIAYTQDIDMGYFTDLKELVVDIGTFV